MWGARGRGARRNGGAAALATVPQRTGRAELGGADWRCKVCTAARFRAPILFEASFSSAARAWTKFVR